jgi:hypothetical protein
MKVEVEPRLCATVQLMYIYGSFETLNCHPSFNTVTVSATFAHHGKLSVCILIQVI